MFDIKRQCEVFLNLPIFVFLSGSIVVVVKLIDIIKNYKVLNHPKISLALQSKFENVLRLGRTIVKSSSDSIPNHSAKPFQRDSHGYLGITTPSNT